jgi:FkbM family methyltransferase
MGEIARKKATSGPLGRQVMLYLAILASLSTFFMFSFFGNNSDQYPDYSMVLGDSLPSTPPMKKHASVQNAIRRTSGEGWEMWNRQAAMPFDTTCRWVNFKATNGVTAPMCVHPGHDSVSDNINTSGRWEDCDRLTSIWERSGGIVNEQSVYMEIGGNIGSCVMQMLLTTKAPIIVFEPHPANQFCLTNTLLALPQDFRDRVSLFPIALGAEKGSSTINAAKGNMGNSVVGTVIKDEAEQQFLDPIPIRIERLDSILNTNNPGWNVPLLKIDAQGFECRIMDAMGSVLERIGAVATEIAQRWLVGQGCSDVGYLDRLRAAGFDIFDKYDYITGAKTLLTGKPLVEGVFDIVAIKPPKEERTSRLV